MHIAHVALSVDPSRLDEFSAVIRDDAAHISSLDGNLGMQVLVDLDDPTAIVLYEEWVDADAIAAYRASDAFAAIGAVVGPMLTAPPVTTEFTAAPA